MNDSLERSQEARQDPSRILNRDIFLYLLDLEVKRAQRYQDFFCILFLKLTQLANHNNGKGLQTCHQKLANLLTEELRESDILGSLEEDRLVALLPYANRSAGDFTKSRFEDSIKFYDFEVDGYEVSIDHICFPTDGTRSVDLIKKTSGPERP